MDVEDELSWEDWEKVVLYCWQSSCSPIRDTMLMPVTTQGVLLRCYCVWKVQATAQYCVEAHVGGIGQCATKNSNSALT